MFRCMVIYKINTLFKTFSYNSSAVCIEIRSYKLTSFIRYFFELSFNNFSRFYKTNSSQLVTKVQRNPVHALLQSSNQKPPFQGRRFHQQVLYIRLVLPANLNQYSWTKLFCCCSISVSGSYYLMAFWNSFRFRMQQKRLPEFLRPYIFH